MKFTLTLLTALLLGLLSARAQAPKRFSYQAVVRGNRNELIKDQQVLVRASILQSTATGAVVYAEDHTPTTNENGLFTLQIGGGTAVSGVFDSIKWAQGNFFLETRIDLANRDITNNPIVGVSQLLSVPYAIYAQQADSTRHALYADSVRGHQVGDFFGGGIIFALWRDRRGQQHGLIASLSDLSNRAWADPEITSAAVGASYRDGAANTAAIVAARGSNTAAGACDAYSVPNGNLPPYTDWYLPAAWELNLLYTQVAALNAILDSDNDASTNGLNQEVYWSSTIVPQNDPRSFVDDAWAHIFQSADRNDDIGIGDAEAEDQPKVHGVRAIRRF